MARNREIPGLFEQYMEQSDETEQWITVQEFRTYFYLDEMYALAIAGFLRRIYHSPFNVCHYRVEKMEKIALINRNAGHERDKPIWGSVSIPAAKLLF